MWLNPNLKGWASFDNLIIFLSINIIKSTPLFLLITVLCQEGWIAFQGFCYFFSVDGDEDASEPRTFAEAEEWCAVEGSTLTAIHSQLEQDFISGS